MKPDELAKTETANANRRPEERCRRGGRGQRQWREEQDRIENTGAEASHDAALNPTDFRWVFQGRLPDLSKGSNMVPLAGASTNRGQLLVFSLSNPTQDNFSSGKTSLYGGNLPGDRGYCLLGRFPNHAHPPAQAHRETVES